VGGLFARSLEGVQIQMEYRIVRPDGAIRWIDARSFPVRDAQGTFIRIVGIAEDITVRHQALDKLHTALAAAEHQAQNSAKLSELLDFLQPCQTAEEAYKVAADVLPQVLGARSGALCITSPSRNLVEAVASWGEASVTEKAFRPDECWALRRGKIHRV